MLQVCDNLCQGSTNEVMVVLQGADHAELDSPTARQMALQKAASMGVTRPGFDDAHGAYPVDAAGLSGDDVVFGRTPVAGYRRDFKIRSAL